MNDVLGFIKKLAVETSKYVKENVESENADKIVKIGSYNSPTSKLDYDTEKFVIDFVKAEFNWNILSEEIGLIDNGSDITLVVDPIDGTYNAINNIPFYSFSVALYHRESCEIGVVINIPTGDLYYAVKNYGAFKNDEKIRVKKASKPYLFVISLGENSSEFSRKIVSKARRIRSLGCASLEMILVAQGSADFFLYDYSPKAVLRIVDIAASTLIVRESGGFVTDLNNNPLNLPLKVGIKENVMAYGDPKILEVLK